MARLGLRMLAGAALTVFSGNLAHAQSDGGTEEPGVSISVSPRIAYVTEQFQEPDGVGVIIETRPDGTIVAADSPLDRPALSALLYGGSLGLNFGVGQSVTITYMQGETSVIVNESGYFFSRRAVTSRSTSPRRFPGGRRSIR